MTREEAIAFFEDMNECTYGNLEAVEMAIEALKQEPILDKIRAEIEQTSETVDGFLMHDGTKITVLQIIDKYKAESEKA